MAYAVKELFYTLQGEGTHCGRAAVFVRFAGCNLWSGREVDRASARCTFCDTEFVGTDGTGGGRYPSAVALARAASAAFRGSAAHRFVVLTGGEPLLQVDEALTRALHDEQFEIAVETNGTQPRPAGIDWVCVSPKGHNALVITSGDELKLVHPQPDAAPAGFEKLDFRHFLLQPKDGPDVLEATRQCVAYCLAHPQWRLSFQTHKALGIP